MYTDESGEEFLEKWRAGEDPHFPIEEDTDMMCGFCLEPYPCRHARQA